MTDDPNATQDDGPAPAQAGGDQGDATLGAGAGDQVPDDRPASGDEQTSVAAGTAPTPNVAPSDAPSPSLTPDSPVLHEGRATDGDSSGDQG
jgi:hypothetical protein